MEGPLVSVVTATYNRSNVLALTLSSVLAQTLEDWELWVVGDACTDDTAEVVRGLGDPRVHYVNLEVNCGDQSAANMEGVRRSSGRFLAFLNHDDLWMPDHLEVVHRQIERTGADMVYALVDLVEPTGVGRLAGTTASGHFQPDIFVPPSAWMLRREAHDRVGTWLSARECYELPSENWMLRAWREGLDMRLSPWMTVVTFPNGLRKSIYEDRCEHEQRAVLDRIRRDPDAFRGEAMTELAIGHAVRDTQARSVAFHLQRAVKHFVRRWSMRFGTHPRRVYNAVRYRRRGGFLDDVQRRRGLPVKPRREG